MENLQEYLKLRKEHKFNLNLVMGDLVGMKRMACYIEQSLKNGMPIEEIPEYIEKLKESIDTILKYAETDLEIQAKQLFAEIDREEEENNDILGEDFLMGYRIRLPGRVPAV